MTYSRAHDGRRRGVDVPGRVAAQLVHLLLHGCFERRVFAARYGLRAINDFHVRVNARAFYCPVAFRVEEAERGRAQASAVFERRVAREADESAPCRRAEKATEVSFAEVVREGVAAGACVAVNQHRLRAGV